jgi:cobalt-zinc-cadmium efflux system outer membrane protein
LRDRWEKVVGETAAAAGEADMQPAMIEAATDDTRSLGLLRPRFSLEIVQSLILLRNPSIKGATDRLQAALEGFDQVTQLDEILRQYSAFTEA